MAAILNGGGHDTAVAGHIAREHTAAYLGEIVLDGDACLVRRQRTHIRGKSVKLGLADVMHGGVLIDNGGQVDGDHLIQDDRIVGQAPAHELRNKLIHADYLLAQLLCLLAAGMQIQVCAENGVKLLGDDLGKVVEIVSRATQSRAALTLAYSVKEGGNGEIGVHPAISQNRLDILNGVTECPFDELAPKHAPLTVVKGGVL